MTATPTPMSAPITGLGCICAAGATLAQTMESLLGGRREPVFSDHIQSSHSVRYPVFQLPRPWAPEGYFDRPESLRCGLLAIEAARQALREAGLDATDRPSNRIGVCIGTTVGSAMNNEAFYRQFHLGGRPAMAPIRTYLRANPAERVAREFGFTGPCQTITNACSSGTVAIGQAAEWIRSGLCDAALAGGADMLCRVIYNGFISLKISDPQPCRPFDADRKGLNLGEGAGLVLMETDDHCRRRGGRPLAHLRGYGNASDAYHLSAPQPRGTGLRRAIAEAMAQASITPADLGFINAHGTGTTENDRVEGRVFTEMLPGTPFVSTKGYTGHTLGASGGIEAAITIASMLSGRVAGNVGFVNPDRETGARPICETTEIDARFAMSDSVAFGGNNAAIIFERADT